MGTPDDVLRFVERFALNLRDSGIPPMPARVFAFMLTSDGERHTAGELADALQVSPAAISGAVRYLVDVRLIQREREPGQRSDLYTLHEDGEFWPRMLRARLAILAEWERKMREGAELVGADHAGGRRLAASADFMAFAGEELPALLDRWEQRRDGRG